jgi:L-ribulokinase
VILERMEEHGVAIHRVINGGGIPQKNETLNRVYANVLNKPVLVPESEVTSLGSAIFAFVAAGAFPSVEAAQEKLCPRYRTVEPDPGAAAVYREMYGMYKKLYCGFGQPGAAAIAVGDVLPGLRRIARAQ